MKTRFNFKGALLAALATTALTAVASTPAMAYYAGETSGLALGAPLPQGFYFVNTTSFRQFSNATDTETLLDIPVLAWSTPWEFLGGRIEAYTAPLIPIAVYATRGTASNAVVGIAGPAILVGEAWDLGKIGLDGFYFSNFVGGYLPISNSMTAALGTKDAFLFNERAAFTYLKNGYNLTAHFVYENYQAQSEGLGTTPDDFMYDLTATKTIGKWEVGAVGWGEYHEAATGGTSTDHFALGALVGYNLPGATVQVYGGSDVERSNLTYNDTRLFARIIVPLGDWLK